MFYINNKVRPIQLDIDKTQYNCYCTTDTHPRQLCCSVSSTLSKRRVWVIRGSRVNDVMKDIMEHGAEKYTHNHKKQTIISATSTTTTARVAPKLSY